MNPLHKLVKVIDDDFGHTGKIATAFILVAFIYSIAILFIVYLLFITAKYNILILIPIIGISVILLYRWAVS
jgi:hypothetical protein